MKTLKISTLSIMLLIFLTLACGKGGSSSAQLEVSRAFAVTNTYFGGGLIITGKNISKNQTFTVSLDSSTSINMQLEKGTWQFSAVAWDGGAAPEKKFSGLTYCGLIEKALVNDAETVDITLSSEKCGDPLFTAGHVDTTATPSTFKSLNAIGTCSTFFPNEVLPGHNIATSLVQASTPADFCNNVSEDLRTDVKSIKIHAQNKTLSQVNPTLGFGTGCLKSATSDSKIDLGIGLRLPYRSIPFTIITFEDENCSKPLAHYDFRHGLNAISPMFDHILVGNNTSTSQMKLFLPGNDLKRAMSPFMGILPSIKCFDGTTTGKCKTSPTSHADFYGNVGSNQRVFVGNQSSCTGSLTVSAPLTSATCFQNDKGVEVEFSGSATGVGSFVINGTTYSVYLANTFEESKKYNAHRTLMEIVGVSDNSLPRSFFMPHENDNDDESYGILSRVREMFSPSGPGGVVGIPLNATTFQKACMDAVGSKEISFYSPEEMKHETYKIVVHNKPVSNPGSAFCHPTNIAENDCMANGVKFEKRMLVFDYAISAIAPTMAFEFSCSSKVGKLEDNSTEIEGDRRKVNKEIISWNTEDSTYSSQRFEKISIHTQHKLISGAWILQEDYRNMTRFMKTAPNGHEFWKYQFNARRDNSDNSFNQHLGSQQFKVADPVGGKVCAFENSVGITNTDPAYLWNSSTYSPMRLQLPKITQDTNDIFFYFSDDWGQATGIGCTVDYSVLPVGADKFQNNIEFRLDSLNSSAFFSKFGTTFISAP